MLTTEKRTRDISGIYKRFAQLIGEKNWKQRISLLKNEIRGNSFLDRFLHEENSIAFQLEHMRNLIARYGAVSPMVMNNHEVYQAACFAAQVLTFMDNMPREQAKRFRRRVQAAFKNPGDMRGLGLEFVAATQLRRRGYEVSWHELDKKGAFDILVDGIGASGLEIECISISEDKGRKVHRRQALAFFDLLRPHIEAFKKDLRTGVSATLTIPDCLPDSYMQRADLAKRFAAQIVAGKSAALPSGDDIQIRDFDIGPFGQLSIEERSLEVRKTLEEVSGTKNQHSIVLWTPAGGALAFTVQSALDDNFLPRVFDTLSDCLKKQLTGKRAGMLLVGFHGVSDDALLSLAQQEKDPKAAQTGLQAAVKQFRSAGGHDHLVYLGFLSDSAFWLKPDGVIDSRGTAYYFPVKESPRWHQDFDKIFLPADI